MGPAPSSPRHAVRRRLGRATLVRGLSSSALKMQSWTSSSSSVRPEPTSPEPARRRSSPSPARRRRAGRSRRAGCARAAPAPSRPRRSRRRGSQAVSFHSPKIWVLSGPVRRGSSESGRRGSAAAPASSTSKCRARRRIVERSKRSRLYSRVPAKRPSSYG